MSFFSTLVIEAALRRVPSSLVAFGQATGGAELGYADRPVGAMADQTRFDHMREVLRWPGILTSKNPMDLVKDVLDQSRWRGSPILDDLQIAAQRVARCDGQAQHRIVAALGEVLAHGR